MSSLQVSDAQSKSIFLGFLKLVGIPSRVQNQSWDIRPEKLFADFGSRIKNKQKFLVGASNHPAIFGNVFLIDSYIKVISNGGFFISPSKATTHYCFSCLAR